MTSIFDRSDTRAARVKRRYTIDEDRPIPASVVDLLTNTRRLYRTWWFTHYFIGLLGVLAGTLLTAITSSKDHLSIGSFDLTAHSWLIGMIAAVATSLVTFLGPLHKAERYWSAYHILERACLEYSYQATRSPRWDKLMQKVIQVHAILQVADLGGKPSDQAEEQDAATPPVV